MLDNNEWPKLGTAPKSVMASEASVFNPSYIFKTYFDDPTSSDLVIKLDDGKILRAHRITLCRRSEYFFKLLGGSFKERSSEQIELHDDNPEAVVAMIRFLYDLPYAQGISASYDGKALLQHAEVYVVAEKYGVENLKPLIYDNISSLLEYNGEKTDLVEAIETIVENTPDNDNNLVRNLLVGHCIEYLAQLRQQKSFMDLLARVGDVGATLIAKMDLSENRI